jgi:hypothetical protein
MYLTLNSQFKPFTYDELVKPLQDYGEAYREVEEQYNDLAQQTEAWKNIATQENSPEAYAMYKKYSDELNAVIEDFSRGMTIQNRGKLSGLKSRYASEITPIATAYTALSNANAFRDEMRIKDDSVIFNIDRYTSLDDFLNGQMVDNSFVSGRTLQADIANQVLTNGYNKYNELIAAGHSKQAAAKIISKGEWINESSILSGIYNNAGITTEEAAAKIKNYTDNGIAQGMITLSSNIESMLLQEQAAIAARYRRGGGGGGGGGNRSSSRIKYDDAILSLYDALNFEQTRTETTKSENQYLNDNNEYETYSQTVNTKEVNLTKSEKLARAYGDDNLRYAASLVVEGVPFNDVVDNYKIYDEGYSSQYYYEDFVGLQNAYASYLQKAEGEPDSFDVFINSWKNKKTNE